MPAAADIAQAKRKYLLRRFWSFACGFWSIGAATTAWTLTAALIAIIVLQVYVQYRLNVWNREVFDALEQRYAAGVLYQAMLFVPLALASIALAVSIIYARTAMQRRWRRWLTDRIVNRWLDNGRYYHLNLVSGDHNNPEYRIAEDVRIASEAPVDFVSGILAAALSAATFIAVLWFVGGAITFVVADVRITIPGFLVLAAVLYAVFASGSMAYIGRHYVRAAEAKLQSEAELRYALTRLRENGESIALIAGEEEEKIGLTAALQQVLQRWRAVALQYMRTTVVAQTSFLVAPVIPVILSAPKYLDGSMSLGQVMQAASAFVTVQTAFAWLVDNYPRFADWSASARRVSSLLVSLDGLERAEREDLFGRIKHGDAPEGYALCLREVSVTLDDGSVVVKDADVKIARGERVLFMGESGSGKSTLVRAIAGLWPWGEGEILMQPNAKVFFMPQKPYIPIGALRRAAIYPMAAEDVSDDEVKRALQVVGLEELADRINEEGPWDQTLSGGERQRVAFARLLIHKPDVIVMDEATAALDKASQAALMQLLHDELPESTIVSVGHRPELEEFHERKLILEYRPGGARIVHDEDLQTMSRRGLGLIRRILSRYEGRRPLSGSETGAQSRAADKLDREKAA